MPGIVDDVARYGEKMKRAQVCILSFLFSSKLVASVKYTIINDITKYLYLFIHVCDSTR